MSYETGTGVIYDTAKLNRILEVGRSQSRILPTVMHPAVNLLIKFVEMHSVLYLLVYAVGLVATTALVFTMLLLWGDCLGNTDATAIYLFMVSTALGGLVSAAHTLHILIYLYI